MRIIGADKRTQRLGLSRDLAILLRNTRKKFAAENRIAQSFLVRCDETLFNGMNKALSCLCRGSCNCGCRQQEQIMKHVSSAKWLSSRFAIAPSQETNRATSERKILIIFRRAS